MKIKIWAGILFTFFLLHNASAQLKYVDNDTATYVKLMFVGDVAPNSKLIESTYNEITNTYDFQPLFHYIRPILNLGDIVACNLETTIGTAPYGVYPTYKSPEEFAVALKHAGFNVAMTANAKTMHQTLDEWKTQKIVLDKARINVLGSFKDKDDQYNRNPTMITKDGVKVAFLNYTTQESKSVGSSPLVSFVDPEQIKDDIFMSKNRGADFVVIYFHWGQEFQKNASKEQKDLANFCIEAGANMIIGTHPHMVQQLFFRNYYSDGGYAEGVVAYSLGDFLSTANSAEVNSACILELVLHKNNKTGNTQIHDYGYIPTYTHQYFEEDKIKWAIMPVSQVERNHVAVPMDIGSKEAMQNAIDKIRYKMSGYMEEVEYEMDNEIIEDMAEFVAVQGRPSNEEKDFKLMDINMLLKYNERTKAKYKAQIKDKIENEYDFFDAPDIEEIYYRVQFLETNSEIEVDLKLYRHLTGYDVEKEDGVFRYYIGRETALYKINDFCLDIKRLGHQRAFVVAYKNGKRISME